jgi:hypothetical protein
MSEPYVSVDYQSYDQWQFRVGEAGETGARLTKQQLYKWSIARDAQMVCVFCGTLVSTTTRCCPRCREYKGLQPAIVGWSISAEAKGA